MCYLLIEIFIYIIVHEMNGLEIYKLCSFSTIGAIDFWLYKLFYMRCNLLEGRSIITLFFLLVLSMYFKNFVSLNRHRKIL